MKDLPLGIEDFSQIGNYYYVDKTAILAELIDSAVGKSVLFTRPRRFGKSLTLSMIECFFTMRKDYSSLFEDKKIWSLGEEYRRHAFSRPVIRLNMKDVSAPSLSSMLEQCYERISALFRLYPEIRSDSNLYPYEKERFDAFANMKTDQWGNPNYKVSAENTVMLNTLSDAQLEKLGISDSGDVMRFNGKVCFRFYVAELEDYYDVDSRKLSLDLLNG